MKHIYHPARSHIHKRIDPKRSKEEKQLGPDRIALILLVPRAHRAQYEGNKFPRCGHDDDPAEGFAVKDGEEQVGEGAQAEEDREGYCGGEGRAVGPLGVAGVWRDIAVCVGDGGCACW